ncbi:hypothetical protein EIP86_009963 [Pleurotus ostreatoroseus]|nr:hypothetical protein EIP86_009963 [Pleurotus ostreatoroseus]
MSTPRRRRYGLFSGKPKRFSNGALRHASAVSMAPPQAQSLPSGSVRQADEHHIYLADMPEPWINAIPEHWRDQMPEYWQTPRHPVRRSFWRMLCLASLGQPDMGQLWAECRHFDTLHVRRDILTERNTTITVVQWLAPSYPSLLDQSYWWLGSLHGGMIDETRLRET